jgi:DNA polymerase-3 subunit gamma/tau
MSLYQQYRPETFADVTGQEHIVSTLEQAVAQGKLAHAYLFAGPRGTGKTSIARILASHILTKGLEPTLAKDIAAQVREGTAVDVIEIDAASNRGIDDVRTLIERIQFSPIHAAAKTYIVDEAHMLTREAFNALLKTLEEPPEYAYFILATTELQKIPATIQSRCQRYAFHEIDDEAVVQRLQLIADKEGITAERSALRSMARAAGGGLRDAIGLLDQLRSLPSITDADVRERLGHSGKEEAERVFEALKAGDRDAMMSVIRDAEETGLSMESLTRECLALARTWLHQSVKDGTSVAGASLLSELLLQAVKDLRFSPIPALVLEQALLRAISGKAEPETARPFTEVPAEKPKVSAPVKKAEPEHIEKKEVPVKPVAKKEEAVATEPEKPTTLEAPELTMQSMMQHWPEITARAKPPAVKMSLKNGRLTGAEGSTVTLRFSSRFHRDRVMLKESLYELEEELQAIYKKRVKIECLLEEETTEDAKQDAVNLADIAAEVF